MVSMRQDNSTIFPTSPEKERERRRAVRRRVLAGGKLLYGYGLSSLTDCLVVELSRSGVRVEIPVAMHIPEELFFRMGNQKIQRVRRVWAVGNAIGLEFLE